MELVRGLSPRANARIAGVFYALIFFFAPSGAATATPLRMIITLICDTAVALIFYDLFRPASRSLSALAALFRLVFVATMAVNSLNYFAYLVHLKSARSPKAFGTGYLIALVPFGFHILLIGYLVLRSTFLPRFLGWLLLIAGPTYPFNSFASFLAPAFANKLWPYIAVPWVVGEGLLTLWLLVKGVSAERWKEQADAADIQA